MNTHSPVDSSTASRGESYGRLTVGELCSMADRTDVRLSAKRAIEMEVEPEEDEDGDHETEFETDSGDDEQDVDHNDEEDLSEPLGRRPRSIRGQKGRMSMEVDSDPCDYDQAQQPAEVEGVNDVTFQPDSPEQLISVDDSESDDDRSDRNSLNRFMTHSDLRTLTAPFHTAAATRRSVKTKVTLDQFEMITSTKSAATQRIKPDIASSLDSKVSVTDTPSTTSATSMPDTNLNQFLYSPWLLGCSQ